MTKRLPKIEAGKPFLTDADTFDMLVKAGVLKTVSTDPWPTYGVQRDELPGQPIECTLLTIEEWRAK